VFRHVILELLPVAQLARHFHISLGAPTKELYSTAGLVFLATPFAHVTGRYSGPGNFKSHVAHPWSWDIGSSTSALDPGGLQIDGDNLRRPFGHPLEDRPVSGLGSDPGASQSVLPSRFSPLRG
jgi:hypothetical protein